MIWEQEFIGVGLLRPPELTGVIRYALKLTDKCFAYMPVWLLSINFSGRINLTPAQSVRLPPSPNRSLEHILSAFVVSQMLSV